MQRINEDIRQEKFRQAYLLYGEEAYLKRQYRDRLKKALCKEDTGMNVHEFEGAEVTAEEVIDLAETMPFFAERRVIFLQESGWFKAGGEKLADYLKDPAPTAFFVFTEKEIDKRSRLFKTVNSMGLAVEFAPQEEGALKRWIAGMLKKEGKKITEADAALILKKAGTDMENLSREVEKLICYAYDREVITRDDIEAVCTVRLSNHIFDMISAIAEKNIHKAIELYYDLLLLREAPMRILFLMARQFNLLLQVKNLKQRGFDAKSIAAKTGLAPFLVGKYAAWAGKFSTAELKQALFKCVEAEEAVKTGKLNDRMSVELLILSVLP